MKHVKAVLALSLAGCNSWHLETRPTSETLAPGRLRTMRVELRSGKRIVLHDASIQGDSLVGFARPFSSTTNKRLAVATADVTRVEFEKTNAAPTAAMVALLLVVMLSLGVTILGDTSGSTGGCQSAAYFHHG